jgi:hypothetical protein
MSQDVTLGGPRSRAMTVLDCWSTGFPARAARVGPLKINLSHPLETTNCSHHIHPDWLMGGCHAHWRRGGISGRRAAGQGLGTYKVGWKPTRIRAEAPLFAAAPETMGAIRRRCSSAIPGERKGAVPIGFEPDVARRRSV